MPPSPNNSDSRVIFQCRAPTPDAIGLAVTKAPFRMSYITMRNCDTAVLMNIPHEPGVEEPANIITKMVFTDNRRAMYLVARQVFIFDTVFENNVNPVLGAAIVMLNPTLQGELNLASCTFRYVPPPPPPPQPAPCELIAINKLRPTTETTLSRAISTTTLVLDVESSSTPPRSLS